MSRALDPFIQVLKPIRRWPDAAGAYTIKDSVSRRSYVIFISLWPMLINTAFGVASVRREWLNVAKTLEMPAWRTALRVICPRLRRPFSPACASRSASPGSSSSPPRCSLAARASVFVWNEWNNFVDHQRHNAICSSAWSAWRWTS